MTITKDDILFNAEKVGEWINKDRTKDTMWFSSFYTLADKITIEQQERISKIADELEPILEDIRNLYPNVEKSKAWAKYIELLKTLRGEK